MKDSSGSSGSLGSHTFEAGSSPALLLLHGTGGDEHDLVPLGRMVAPGRALFSPRGRVLENGMPRFFRRLGEGVFDEEDVARRADELAETVLAAGEAYGFERPIAFGFSNGANIAAAVLARRPDVLGGAILVRAQAPFREMPSYETNLPILLLNGRDDPLISLAEANKLNDSLSSAGARVDRHVLDAGHGLIQQDVDLARDWLRALQGDG